MTDKEMRRLSRQELLDIIYEMKQNEQQLQSRLEQAELQVKNREICITQAGSIAEAALKLNGVFAAAQAAADQYLENLEAANQEKEKMIENARLESEQIVAQAKRKATEMLRSAERQSNEMVKKAEADVQIRWDALQKKANELLAAHSELKAFLSR